MNNNNNKKFNKWTPEWEKEVKRITWNTQVDKLFKKGEKELKDFTFTGEELTADKTIKVNELEYLIAEIKVQKKKVEDKQTELTEKNSSGSEVAQIVKEIKKLEPAINWYQDARTRFLEGNATGSDGTALTNGYGAGNVGWVELLKKHLERKTTDGKDYGSNLYEFSTRTEKDDNQISYWRLTENEVIKLITRVVKELGKIDKAKFDAYVNGTGSSNLANGTNRPATDFTQTNVIKWLDDIRDRAKVLVDNTIKTDNHLNKGQPANGHRVEYSFGEEFTKHGTNTAQTTLSFTHTELEGLFNLMKLFGDTSWASHADLKTAIAEVNDDTLIVLPAKSDPLPSSKLKELGIQGYVDDNGKSNFYETDYGSKEASDSILNIHTRNSWDSQKSLKIEGGIEGWAKLINGIAYKGMEDINRKRLISSFTNDPVKQLMNDLREIDKTAKVDKTGGTGTGTPNYGVFGTNHYTYLDRETHDREERKFDSLTILKESLLNEVKTNRKEVEQLEKDFEEEKKKLLAQETEINNKITEAITAKQKELKEKYKVDDNTSNDFTNDNKITADEHWEFQKLVLDIRFLVNNDEEKPTGKINEDQAYQSSKELINKYVFDFLTSLNHFDALGFKSGESDEERAKRTIADKIAIIKENKDNEHDYYNLNHYHDKLVEMEKLFKLSPKQSEIKTKLKEAIDNQTPEESNQDWRNTLKTIQADLETAFTDAKITEWKKKKDGQTAFNNTASIKSLLEKVVIKKSDGTIEKINDEFITFIKTKDAKLADLTKLIELKEPREVILLIHQWEFDKLSEEKKKERYLKFAWSEKGGKQKIDSKDKLEDDEKTKFEEYLYECAIGKINENSLTKPTEENGDGNDNQTTDDTKWYQWGGYMVFWLPPLVIASGVAIFWKQISEWWNGSKEESGSEEQESELVENEDDKEE